MPDSPRDPPRFDPLLDPLFDGGVNGRNPPRFSTGDWLAPRGLSVGENPRPLLSEERLPPALLPLGGVNGRKPPRSTGCEAVPRGDSVGKRFPTELFGA